jgi:hypothetical protein
MPRALCSSSAWDPAACTPSRKLGRTRCLAGSSRRCTKRVTSQRLRCLRPEGSASPVRGRLFLSMMSNRQLGDTHGCISHKVYLPRQTRVASPLEVVTGLQKDIIHIGSPGTLGMMEVLFGEFADAEG